MDETTVYQNGKSQKIKNQYLKGFINSGWTQTAPTTQPVDNSLLKGGTDLTMINPKPALGAVGMGEELAQTAQANQDQYTQDLANKSKTAETQKSTSLEDLVSGLTNQKGETQLQDETYKNTVDPLETELKDINQQIFSEQQGVRRKLEELDKNPQGLFGGALADEKNRIQNDSLKKQADLSVIQMGIQGRYDSAKAIADRAIQVQLEKQKNAVEALRLNYEDKKDLFTKAEQREFETKQSARERELDKQEKEMQTISDMSLTALQNGAPSSVASAILKSKDYASAVIAGAKYMTDPLDRAIKSKQLEKISKEIADMEKPVDFNTIEGTPNDLLGKMLNSATQKSDLSQSEREKLAKMNLVISQLGTLQNSIKNSNKTGIIKGRVNNITANLGANPEAGYINAQIQALVPNVARGIYGEVGVLTDADIANYKKTLPNIKTVDDQNNLVLAMTLKNAMLSYEGALKSAVNSNINVSGWAQDYAELKNKVADVEDKIGIPKVKVDDFYSQNPQYQNMIKELVATGKTDREIIKLLGIE